MKKILQILIILVFTLLSENLLAQGATVGSVQKAGGGTPMSTACTGQTIRIVGGNFEGTGMTIIINGGTPINSYTFLNVNTIELVIPLGTPGGGPGVTVTNSFGPSTPITLNVIQGINFIPPVSSQTLCEGSPLGISASPSNGGSLVYQWQKNGGNISGANATNYSIPAVVPADAANYTLMITSMTCSYFVITPPSTLIVNQLPTTADAFVPTNPNVLNNCQNPVFNMSANTPAIGTGTWTLSSGTGTITTASSPSTTITAVPQETPVVLNWTITNGVCPSSISSVNLYNYSMPNTTAAIVGSPTQDICISSPTTTLTGNTPSGLFTNVDWIQTGGPAGSIATPTTSSTSFTASVAGNYTFSYIIRNGNCNSISPDLNLIVHDIPLVSAGGSMSNCFGTPFVISGSATSANTFSWSLLGAAGSLSSNTIVNPTYTSFGSDSLGVSISAVIAASNNGCGIVRDTAVLTIHQKPMANIAVGTPSICVGGSTSITINLSGTAPFTGLGLFNGTTNVNLGSIPGTSYTASVSPTSSTNYTLSPIVNFKDNNNCVGSISGSIFVSVSPAPTATVTVNPGTICAGSSSTLAITPNGGGGPNWTVYYNAGGGTNISSTISSGTFSTSVSPLSTTTYVIDSIETTTCGKIKVSGISALLTVNASPLASAAMTMSATDDTLCNGESTIITIDNVQANTIYKLVKNFNAMALDSFSVPTSAPASINMTLSYSKFTLGTKDTIYFVARRPGCNPVSSVSKIYTWSSLLVTPNITVLPATAACSRKILQVTNVQPGVSYQWYETENLLVGNLNSKDTAFFPGSYYTVAFDDFKCKNTSNILDINYNAQKPEVEAIDLSTAETKLFALQDAQKYHWYVQTATGTKIIKGDTTKSISVYFDGNYFLGTINNSCFFMSNLISVTGKLGGSILNQGFVETDSSIIIPKPNFSQDVNIYPNPVVSESEVKVDYIAGNVTKVSFILYNSQGLIMTRKEVEGDGILRTFLSIRDFPSGIYNLYINDGVKQLRRNIMVY